MIKGLALTPPVLGRISIGKVVEKNGKRLPEKDDQFTITSQVQNKDGWVLHPLDEALRAEAKGKIRSIPVRVLFNDPDLNLRAEYSLFDRKTGRPVCVGDGETCKRVGQAGIQSLPCPSPSTCEFGAQAGCKPYGRLTVQIAQDDELGSFVFRTTGFNSIRTLAARLSYFKAVSGNLLSCLPLELKLRGKSTTQSHRAPVYYVDLTIRDGMTLEDAISEAKARDEKRKQIGHDQEALDEAAKVGFANGAFEESEDEIPAVLEEFYPAEGEAGSGNEKGVSQTLQDKLDKKTKAASTGGEK
jgi:Recombination directionality factor-like